MSVTKPFKRTCRQLVDGTYQSSGNGRYVRHPLFASDPVHYIRAFEILQKDVLELFDFVEPSDVNQACYSYRIHDLHTRACIEVEANCKAIMADNGYPKAGDWNMSDYRKLNTTHRLSSYQIQFPVWHGTYHTRTPFASWKGAGRLEWYQAYNEAKHSRHENFKTANFRNLLDAVAGLVALLASQFITADFGQSYFVAESDSTDFEYAIGGYFRVKLADDWPAADRYDFDWQLLKNDPKPFQTLIF
jgi:hypothetical protein